MKNIDTLTVLSSLLYDQLNIYNPGLGNLRRKFILVNRSNAVHNIILDIQDGNS